MTTKETIKLEVGKSVDGWCTRCKLVLRHTIEAMAAGKITRVHCNTCGGQHAHRKNAPRTPGTGAKRARRAGDEQATRQSDYQALLRGRTRDASRPYAMTQRFAVGELIAHATFGLGVVTGERDSSKIDIVFPDGPKVLMQGR